jgi:SOS response associated peptidase (SRAP)
LHHRVPVTIAEDNFERWLDCRANDVESAMALLTGPEVGEFAWHQVSARVNHAANDDAQLILPITDEERQAEEAPKPARKAVKPAARKPAPAEPDDGQGSLF